jgi:hypothetical protein
MKRFRKHVIANIVAYIALVLATTGTASALIVTGDMIADESVGWRDLGPNSVGASELAEPSVTRDQVQDNTLQGADIDESTLDTPAGGLVTSSQTAFSAWSDSVTATATCPQGRSPIAGGFKVLQTDPAGQEDRISILRSEMFGQSWVVTAKPNRAPSLPSGVAYNAAYWIQAQVICGV